MNVRNSTWNNRYTKSVAFDTSHFQPYDIEHVGQKFPEAQKFIIDRLGKAISRRRQYLKYREEHAFKLAFYKEEHGSTVAPSETTASAYDEHFDKEVVTQKDEDMQSETSYATSLSRSTNSRMPRIPKEAANEQPFECPFCHTIAVVKDMHGWKKHVYRDLQPYVCTFRDCATADETYESRRQWFSHELQKHRRVWACSAHCQQTFPSATQLITHMKKFSTMDVPDAQLPAFIEMRASPVPKNAKCTCPLCSFQVTGTSSLQKHLGRHLEELALFALPVDAAADEIYIIKCVCGSQEDDGNTVYCEECETWQHIKCYYGQTEVPDVHDCVDCVSEERTALEPKNNPSEGKSSIHFRDAIGRNLTFPFNLCKTWHVSYHRNMSILNVNNLF